MFLINMVTSRVLAGNNAVSARLMAILLAFALAFGGTTSAEAKPQFSAISVDARTGAILFSSDPDGYRYPASLTKMMTLYVLFQDLKAGRIKLSTPLRVSKRAASMAPSKLGLKPGSTISVEHAIKALVTKSANDVAATIGENLGGTEANFAGRMTRVARTIGMSRSTFKNASGLPNPGQKTTARDMATLGLRLMRDFPQYYPYFRITSFNYKGQIIKSHNRLVGRYAGTDGIKTGYIAASGFNLTTSTKRGDKRLVGVVLGATSTASRNAYMMKMLDKGFPKARGGKGIAAKPGSAKGVKDPVAAAEPMVSKADSKKQATPETVESAEAIEQAEPEAEAAVQQAETAPATTERRKKKLKPLFGGKKSEQNLETSEMAVAAEDASQETVGSTSKTVIAEGAEAEQPEVLEAKMDTASTEAPAPISGETVMPKKLPFEVKSAQPDGAGEIVVASVDDSWNIQIGAYPSKKVAQTKLSDVRATGVKTLAGKQAITVETQKGSSTMFRARFIGFTEKSAKDTCAQLKKFGQPCLTVPPAG